MFGGLGPFEIAIIADVRFPSEVGAISGKVGYRLIRLNREFDSTDEHPSETSLDSYDWSSLADSVLVIDNDGISMEEKNALVCNWLSI